LDACLAAPLPEVIFLLGTVHVARQCAEDVRKTILVRTATCCCRGHVCLLRVLVLEELHRAPGQGGTHFSLEQA
jgi:hypothetical protein